MLIGVPKEIKTREYRVGMTPAGVRDFVAQGHRVLVQASAGEGSGISDEVYERAVATIVRSAADVWAADMVVKVKEKGIVAAAKADRAVLLGVNTFGGGVTYGPVAQAHNLEYVPVEKALG